MSPFNPRHPGIRHASRGATPRRDSQVPSFDRWLNRAVDITVITALLVGAVALALHLL